MMMIVNTNVTNMTDDWNSLLERLRIFGGATTGPF